VADMKMINQMNQYIESQNGEALGLLKELGKIPAPSYHEEKRAEFCMNWLKEQGAKKVWIDEAKNVICEIDCDQSEDIVVFMAHTDIVFPDEETLPLRQDGNKLYAPGIGDDTANLVHLLMAAKYILTHQIAMKKKVLIVANSCEEGLGNLEGCKAIFKKFGDRISEFFSFDGYLSQCTSVPVGSYRYKITVKGEGGHSYLDFGNENAISTMAAVIVALDQIELPSEDKTTFNVGVIQGGSTVNSIPQDASLLYEYRSPSQRCLMEMERKFNEVITSFKDVGKAVSVEILGIRPGRGQLDEEKFKVWTEANIAIIKKYYDGEMDVRPYSTDANIPLSMGIYANTIGTVVGGDAHKREEWIDIKSIPTGMSIVLDIVMKYAK